MTELLEFVTTQYEDLVETSTMSDSESWKLVVDCFAHIFEQLHNARSEVNDTGHYNEGIFLWGMLRAWEIQERYR
jgi:rhamnogalacturonyl hydrolase YesR